MSHPQPPAQCCGHCRHWRPFAKDEGYCGMVLPEVKFLGWTHQVYGTAPTNQADEMPQPIFITVRPEMNFNDPDCADFEWNPTLPNAPGVDDDDEDQAKDPALCVINGCQCKADKGSSYCADHDPEEIAGTVATEGSDNCVNHDAAQQPDDLLNLARQLDEETGD